MAQPDNTAEPKKGEGDDLLATAAKRWASVFARERTNVEDAYTDLKFLASDDEVHWGPGVRIERENAGRPCFVVNKLGQYVEQVTGDQRQMRPSMRVVPVDSRASTEVADILGGLMRYIEHRSAASTVYNRAAESQVSCGVGAWRVVTEYAADSTFNQEIGVQDIDDPVMVLFDSDATKLSRSDAMFAFVPVDLSRDAFEAQYPGKTVASFGESGVGFGDDWVGDDHVRVAEYWYKQPEKKLLALLPDGGIDDLTDERDPAKIEELKAAGARVEERDAFCVYRAVISSTEVLEPPTKWPGRYIPIVPVLGREIRLGRRVVRKGVVRDARDAQRLYNFGVTAQVEWTSMQPKSPYVGTEKMFEEHADQWEAANIENRPYLAYTPDPNAPGARPQREAPPQGSPALANMVQQAAADIEGTIGIYKSSIGAESNEKSGKAILAREKQADTSTYVFIQNFSEAIAHTARIVLDLIPHVYDTERVLRVIGVDGAEELIKVNQPNGIMEDGADLPVLNDVTIGAYDVVLESGPSYATKREEAREGMMAFIQGMPNAAPLVADLIAKAMDWPNAEAFAERLKAGLPPQIAAKEAEENGEGPPPPDPAMVQQQIQMQVQQAQAHIQDMQAQAEAKLALERQAIDLAKREVMMQAKMAQMQAQAAQAQPAADAGAVPLEAQVQQAEQSIALQKEQAQLQLDKEALDLQRRELALMAKQFEDKVNATAQAGADTEAKGQAMAQAMAQTMAGIQEMPSVIVQALAPALQQQSEQISQLTEAMEQLLAIAQAPNRILRDEMGRVLGSEKVLN
ncbi:MAG: portal protein [Xanthobacteraceae bacterium]